MDVNAQTQEQERKRLTALVRKDQAEKRVQELADQMERQQAEADAAEKEVRAAESALAVLRPLTEERNDAG